MTGKYGAHLVVDGLFGSGTRASVVQLQANRGLSQTGTVDLATWQELVGWSQTYDQSLCDSTGGTPVSGLTTAQLAKVNTMIDTAQGVGGNRNAQIITLMAAMQESKLCNIQFGDRDSLRLFDISGWESMATTLVNTYGG